MPTIKTIKPAGGGDYTTLQDWWDSYASLEANAGQWAECYVGECGPLDMTTHTGTPDSGDYYMVYGAADNWHDGSSGGAIMTSGATTAIKAAPSYTRVYNMHLILDNSGGVCVQFNNTGSGWQIHGCLIVNSTAPAGQEFSTGIAWVANTNITSSLKNNVIKGFYTDINAGGVGTGIVNIWQQTCEVGPNGNVGISFAGFQTYNAINNIVVGASNANFQDDGNGTLGTFDNNISEDATAGALGGSDNQDTVDPTSIFTDYAGEDYTLSNTSVARNAGFTIPSVSTDILGVARPQSTAYDIGAFEGLPVDEVVNTSGGTTGNQSMGRITVYVNRSTQLSYDGASAKQSTIASITNKYIDNFDDTNYYQGDSG